MINRCEECKFEFNSVTSTSWNDFTDQFEILSSEDYSGAGSGVAKCKKCGLEFNWEHENFIYSKLLIIPKNVK